MVGCNEINGGDFRFDVVKEAKDSMRGLGPVKNRDLIIIGNSMFKYAQEMLTSVKTISCSKVMVAA